MNDKKHVVLSPLTSSDFFANHWEKDPVHIERRDNNYFTDLITIREIDALLSDSALQFPDFQLTNANKSITASDYRSAGQRIDAAAVRRLHVEGATLIISAAHLKFPALADLCRSVTSHFMMRSQANVYLSPASQQGFNPHFDTHDVFILQASGSKTFRFYTSDIALPFTDDTFDPALCSEAQRQQQITVNAGDTLYIPRGIVHDAVACGEAPSLHITLGVFPLIVRDLLQEIVQVAGEQDEDLRRSLLKETDVSIETLSDLFAKCINDDVLQIARSRLADDVALSDMSATGQSLQTGPLTLEHVVQLVQSNVINIESDNDYIKIRLHGQILEFEGALTETVRWLLDNKPGRVEDLPGSDQKRNLELCNQLFASGLLTIVP